jgi:O-acetylhomoserine (thiol)-lyase
MSEEKKQQLATLAVHAGQVPDPTTGAASTPIFQTSSYVFHDAAHAGRLFGLKEPGYIYSRIMNPTTDVLEQRVAALEGGAAALATASGLAAEDLALSTLADSGDEIVSTTSLYGGTYSLLAHTFPRRSGVKVRFADADDFGALSAAINDKTKALYTETLGNPKLDVADIETLAKIAHDHKLPLVIDNTAASPALVRPIEWGADIVVNSATKFLSGHGSVIAGVIVDSGKFDWEASGRFTNFTNPDPSYHGLSYTKANFGPLAFILKARVQGLRNTGATLSPFSSWIVLQGIETLQLRLQRHSENALAVAKHLEKHPGVTWVNYPGLESSKYHKRALKYLPDGQGGLVTFGIKGGIDAGRKLIDKLNTLPVFSLLANIGDVKSLVIHPASTTHEQLSVEEQAWTGITPELVRLSVGIEDIRDIIADLDEAIETANGEAFKA